MSCFLIFRTDEGLSCVRKVSSCISARRSSADGNSLIEALAEYGSERNESQSCSIRCAGF